MTRSELGKSISGRMGLGPALMVDMKDYLQTAKNLVEKAPWDAPVVEMAMVHALIAIAEQGLPIEVAARAEDRPPAGAMHDPLDRFNYCVEFGSSDDLHAELAAEVVRLRGQVARVRHVAESTGDRVWAQRILVALAVPAARFEGGQIVEAR